MINFNKKTKLQLALIIIVISSVIIIPSIPKSYAHAFLTSSDPSPSQTLSSPPTKVDAYFNDIVDIRFSQLKVLDSNGKEVQIADLHYINGDQSTLSVSLPSNLGNGLYTVSTKVLDATDGHVTVNAFVFGVGQAVPKSPNPSTGTNSQVSITDIPNAIARFPALLGQIMVAGAASTTLWLWSPISKVSWLRERSLQLRQKIDSTMLKFSVIGSIIILTSGLAMILVQAYSINAGILDAISTKFGSMWILRMNSSAALFALSLVMYYKVKKSPIVLPRAFSLLLLCVSFAVLLTSSLISHGAATGQVISLLLDFFHNIFASLWIGGIFYISFIVIPHLKQVEKSSVSLSLLSLFIPRFSTLVITVLGAIVITGPFLLYVLESNLALTLASFYGKVLIIKLSLAAAMITLGAYDHILVNKKLSSMISNKITKNKESSQDLVLEDKIILNKFGTSIKISAFLGIALIASVAILVDSGIPSSEFQNQLQSSQSNVFALTTNDGSNQHEFSQTIFIENGSRMVLSITPFVTGNNDLIVSFLDSKKNPVDLKSVQVKLTQTDEGIGPITLDANRTSIGTFTANTDFGFPGHWSVRVEGVPNKENALNLVGSFDLLIKPKLQDLILKIQGYKTPGNSSKIRYPLFDASRNKIWAGDINIQSGKILDFDLGTTKFTEHKIDGLNSVIFMALDSQNTIWYIDYQKKMLGHYYPDNNTNKDFLIPSKGILSSMAIDSSDTIWMTAADTAEILKFDIKKTKFDTIKLADRSEPLGLAIDYISGKIWIAEGIGKIASVDSSNYKIAEYEPTQSDYTLASPTGIIIDPQTGLIYISEHEGHAVSVFDPLLKTFNRIQLDPRGLPFGMVFDKYHNLWIAQHTLDKIVALDTRTGETIEKIISTSGSLTQWLSSDSQGDIILAEENASSIGIMTITPGLLQTDLQSTRTTSGIPTLGISYAQVVAPSITGLLVVVAFFYCKGVVDLKRGSDRIKRIQ